MSGPEGLAAVAAVPHGRTARRLDWLLLPPMVRKYISGRLGSPVADAVSAGSGFTPGFASVLTGENGAKLFVKAANKTAQRPFAEAYREEIRKLEALPPGLPVPRLLWSHEDDLWVILGFEYVPGRNPARPWGRHELDDCLDMFESIADSLTPAPPNLRLHTFAEDFAHLLPCWDHVREADPDWPHLQDVIGLAERFEEATAGNTLVHTDGRDDNILLAPGRAPVLCDWNFPVLGAAWIDTVLLLISVHGDGLDADAHIAARRLTRTADPEHIDILLALLCGYFLERRDQPVPNSSPYLRVHSRWYSEAIWSWLALRRGWS